MCFNSGKKAARKAEKAANKQIAEQQRIHAEQLAQQQSMHAEEQTLRTAELEETKRQNAVVAAELEKQRELAERPAPPAALPTADVVTGGSDAADASTETDILKKGRRGLRIDLTAGGATGGSTGLNVPKG